jgi:hypothetical protein
MYKKTPVTTTAVLYDISWLSKKSDKKIQKIYRSKKCFWLLKTKKHILFIFFSTFDIKLKSLSDSTLLRKKLIKYGPFSQKK